MMQRSALRMLGWSMAALCASAVAASGAAAAQLKPGLWKLEAKTETQGMPVPIGPQDRVFTRCLNTSEVRHPWRELQQSTAGECVFSNFHRSGDEIVYSMHCAGQNGGIAGRGTADFDTPTRYESKSELRMDTQGLKISMHTAIDGRWLGACTS